MSNKTWPEYPPQGGAQRPNRIWVLIVVVFAAALGFVLSARNTEHARDQDPQPAISQTEQRPQPAADTPTPGATDKLRGHTDEEPTPTAPSPKPR